MSLSSQFRIPRILISGIALLASIQPVFPEGEIIDSSPILQSGVSNETVTFDMLDAAIDQLPAPTDGASTTEYDLLTQARDYLNAEVRWKNELLNLEEYLEGADLLIEDLENQLREESARVYANPQSNQESVEDEIQSLQEELEEANNLFSSSRDRISGAPEKRLVELERSQSLEVKIRELEAEEAGNLASQLSRKASIQALTAEYEYLSLSLVSVDTMRNIDIAIRDINQLKVSRIEPVITELNASLAEFRAEALRQQEKEAEEALREAALKDPALESLAVSTQQYSNDRKELDVQIRAMDETLIEFNALSKKVEDLLSTMKKRLSISGNSPNVGALIQRGLHSLPDPNELNRRRKTISKLVRTIQIDLLELEIDRGENPWLRPEIVAFLSPENSERNAFTEYINRNTVTELVDQRNTVLDDLIKDKNRYFETLVSIDVAVRKTLNSVDDFQKFAVTNSIWIPDRKRLQGRDIAQIPEIVGDAASAFSQFVVDFFGKSRERLGFVALGFLALIGLAILGEKYVRPHRTLPLVETNLWHLSVPFLFELYVVGIVVVAIKGMIWTIDAPNVAHMTAFPLKNTLAAMVKPISFIVLLYRICGDQNIGVLQYGWSRDSTQLIRRTFRRALAPCIIFMFIAGVIYRTEIDLGQEAGSRIFYLIGMFFSIYVMYKIFHSETGIFANIRNRTILRTNFFRKFIHWLLILWPAFLSVLLSMGYVVGVAVFYSRTISSLWLVGVMAVVSGFYIRLTRSMRLRGLLAWREKRREDPTFGDLGIGVDWREFRDQGKELRKILGVFLFIGGMLFIWTDTIPALGAIWEVPLLQSETAVLLTIGQLSRVIVCIITTAVLSMQLPNILQVLIFSNLGTVTQGNRYALSTLLSYLVVITGVIWGSLILKIEWASLQWIFAAISVGLGFGMKEIFGNLFAGIILLFERPIRVGDVVTIGLNTGKVHRIRIRSTTIRQGDKREVIIPNMEIIMGQLINWTLSDSMTRLELLVRTGMDADVDQVIGVLEEEMRNSEQVLEKPEPFAILREIGESSLVFCCYAYVSEMKFRKFAKTDVQRKVLERFRELNISIPYPKYDIRVLGGESGSNEKPLTSDQYPDGSKAAD